MLESPKLKHKEIVSYYKKGVKNMFLSRCPMPPTSASNSLFHKQLFIFYYAQDIYY